MNKQRLMKLIALVICISIVILYFTWGQQLIKNSRGVVSNPFPAVENPNVSPVTEIIDRHLIINSTLRNVNFCGTNYRVKQIIIDGVDVLQRLAEILSAKASMQTDLLSKSICKDITANPVSPDSFTVERFDENWQRVVNNNDTGATVRYLISVNRFMNLIINYPSLQVEISADGEGGSAVIGVLK